ncbi:acyltransferase family protein [Weeksellaceae bacterium KMM 9724]|uniref:acyltransferase family protein n=1 Tax=Profundicola chukchiensis TaxID=2961959 RepID=UPI00243C9A50|nr:acyltransferase family protein [Profundicola chukchiensis]MDG4950628.1 acyltransferase family protein [Profundicola chukchiensis]
MSKNQTSKRSNVRKHLNEIVLLRSLACISIVFYHSIRSAQKTIPQIPELYNKFISAITTLFTFGTPTFIFISILLITYSYPNGLPKDFLSRRFKLIFIPYISMAIIYPILIGLNAKTPVYEIISNIYSYLLGGYHGYFILIIFQFYLLIFFFNRFLKNSNPLKIIIFSLLINVAYLAIFNFTNNPIDNQWFDNFWQREFIIPFVGWISYFSIAYYSGMYMNEFLNILSKYKFLIISSTILIAIVTTILIYLKLMPGTSKSVGMLFFTTGMIGCLYLLAIQIKKLPRALVLINNYSFPIYLLHLLCIAIFRGIMSYLNLELGIISVIPYFIISLIGPICIAYVANKFAFGKYIVGKVNVIKNKQLAS